jgi:hypothetical protein
MRKAFRIVLSVALLAVLGVIQAPKSATCEMAYGGFIAASCQMPCCKTHMPMSKCPFLRTSAPRDIITSSTIVFKNVLQSVHHAGLLIIPQPLRTNNAVTVLGETLRLLFFAPSVSVRAPPADVVLINA